MEGMTQRRKSWVTVTKKSFLSKSACLEQLTGIQATGPGDFMGRDPISMRKPVVLGAKEGDWQFHQSIHEEIPGAENTPEHKAEICKEWLKPFE